MASVVMGIVMTALTTFFVSSVSAASRQGGQQVAVQVADDATERVHALKGSAIVAGRDKTSSDTQWASPVAGVAAYLADTQEAWDASAAVGAGASAALPTSPRTVTVNGIGYKQYWYIGRCWQPLAGGDCVIPQVSDYVPFFRVVVAVTWPERLCTAGTCSYVTSTLVSTGSGEPVFGGGQSAQPPRVNNPGVQTGEVGVPVGMQMTATGGAPPLIWTATGLPPGLVISSDGLISGTPAAPPLPGSAPSAYIVTITETDAFGLEGSAQFTWTINPLPGITSPGNQTTESGTPVSLAIAATPGTSPLAWSASGLPAGLSINASTGVISGTPTTVGVSAATVTVTDASAKTATAAFTWTVTSVTYRSLIVSDGPKGYWRLGESSGTTAVDEMGASNGTYAGGYMLGRPGALINDPNTAANFDGGSARVSIPSVSALDLTSRVSIEAWVNPDTLAGTRWIVNKGTAYFMYIADGVTYFGVLSPTGGYLYVTTTAVTAGSWQHLAGTYDGTKLVLYRNGVVVAQAAAISSIVSSAQPVTIGSVDTAGGAPFDGDIDEVAIYGSALSAAQVQSHFQRGNSTRPAVAITFPAPGGVYTTSSWNAGCTSSICGTATDTGGGVASVTVSVRQDSTGNYWNGTSFASPTEVLLAATGTTSWMRAFAGASFPADGGYTIRAIGTDSTGNSGSASIGFTIDRTAPTVALTFPANGASYGVNAWNAGCSSSICGTAADTGGGVASVTVSVRQDSTGNYWNGTSFASPTEVLLAATGTTSWTRAFAGASFPADGGYTIRAVATDAAGNTASTSATVSIDRTPPAPTVLTLYNASGTVTPGTDEVRITFSEALDTSSICSAWSGTGDQTLSANGVVTVTITDNGTNDLLTVSASTCTVHVGTVATGRNYVTSTATFNGSLSSASRLTWTASSRLLTIHLGARASGTLNGTAQATTTVTYTPDAAIDDPAGNTITTTPFTSTTGQRF